MKCSPLGRAVAAMAVLLVSNNTWGQPDASEPLGYVTALTGGGATRGADGEPFEIGRFLTAEKNWIRDGESVVTLDDGEAVVMLPDYGTAVRLAASSELVLTWRGDLSNDVPIKLTLRRGRASMLRRATDERWIVLEAVGPQSRAYTISKQASLTVAVDADGVSFGSVAGSASFFSGDIPDERLVDDTGQLIDQPDQQIGEGMSISTQQPDVPVADDDNRMAAMKNMDDNLYRFGLDRSTKWVESAEQGDFTPVRAEAQGAEEFLSAELSSGVAFDQARSQVIAQTRGSTTQPLRVPSRSVAEGLLASGVPTSVIVGQRLKRSRIIGNPGTATGQIRFNPQAQQLIRLSGRSR